MCVRQGLSVIEIKISCQGDKNNLKLEYGSFFPNILKAINCILQEGGLKLNSS